MSKDRIEEAVSKVLKEQGGGTWYVVEEDDDGTLRRYEVRASSLRDACVATLAGGDLELATFGNLGGTWMADGIDLESLSKDELVEMAWKHFFLEGAVYHKPGKVISVERDDGSSLGAAGTKEEALEAFFGMSGRWKKLTARWPAKKASWRD